MLTSIASVLKKKGHDVWSVCPAASVAEALDLMTQKRVEALLVLSERQLAGIVSERDCARTVILQRTTPKEVPVSAVMSSPVVFVSPTHTVGDSLSKACGSASVPARRRRSARVSLCVAA